MGRLSLLDVPTLTVTAVTAAPPSGGVGDVGGEGESGEHIAELSLIFNGVFGEAEVGASMALADRLPARRVIRDRGPGGRWG